MTQRKVSKTVSRIFFYLLVAILCIVFVSPFVIMLSTAFKTMKDAFTIPVKILPRQVVLSNFPDAINKIPYLKYMGNTIFITFFSVLGQLIVAPMVAYSVARIDWRGSKIISALLMATMMIPYTVTMIPLYKIWSTLGLTGTYLPLIVPNFAGNAFYIIILRQFFAGLPNSLFEASEIDGAGEFRRYVSIALPLCKPALTTVGIYSFLAAWSDYLAPLIYINNKDKLTLSLGLQQFINEHTVDWTLLMAAAFIFVIPIIIVFIVFQRNFVEGVATTGMKA